jgi:hypothetical protein
VAKIDLTDRTEPTEPTEPTDRAGEQTVEHERDPFGE